MTEEIVKDYGNWTIPTKWEDITLGKFIEIMKFQEEKGEDEMDMLDIASLLSGKSRKELQALPTDFMDTIFAHMLFLNEPLDQTPKDSVTINGETYRIKHEEKLKFGEYVDSNTVMKDKYAYAPLLAILCRKDGEVYDDDFIADKMDERTDFWNNQPITNVYPLVCFFLALSAASPQALGAYLTDVEQTLSQSIKDIKSSLTIGEFVKRPLNSVKIWWKLTKLEKCISQLS